jgi:outer membrane protein assembly factor BamB
MPRHASLIFVAALLTLSIVADDYPQWMGPKRDGVWREKDIAQSFPAAGPKVLWRAPVAAGYAGPAVAAGKVIVTDFTLKPGRRNPDNPFNRSSLPGVERVLCLDDATGNQLWKIEYDVDYTVSYAGGPRCTPTIDVPANRVYTLGAEGHLHCLDLNSGNILWKKKLEGPTPVWGFAGHPLIDGENLICLTSGKEALVTAFNKNTGDIVWKALTAQDPGYCPPTIYTVNGTRQLFIFYPDAISCLDPSSGKVHWTHPHGPVKNGVSIVPPLLIDNTLFITSPNEGLLALKLNGTNAPEKLYYVTRKGRTSSTLHALMNPMVYHEGRIFAVHFDGELRCIDSKTGQMTWETTAPTTADSGGKMWFTAFITPHQPDPNKPAQTFFIANENGDLIIANLTANAYKELSRAHLLDPTNTDARRPNAALWSHPAYANKSLYWRNDKELIRVSMEK